MNKTNKIIFYIIFYIIYIIYIILYIYIIIYIYTLGTYIKHYSDDDVFSTTTIYKYTIVKVQCHTFKSIGSYNVVTVKRNVRIQYFCFKVSFL